MALSNLDKNNVNRLMESLSINSLEVSQERDLLKYNATSCGKLEMIIEQMKLLKSMAIKTLETCEQNKKLHNADCKFEKIPNNVYHFYEKDEGIYCSMLSPDDWNGNPPHVHYGSYLLKADMEFYNIDEL